VVAEPEDEEGVGEVVGDDDEILEVVLLAVERFAELLSRAVR